VLAVAEVAADNLEPVVQEVLEVVEMEHLLQTCPLLLQVEQILEEVEVVQDLILLEERLVLMVVPVSSSLLTQLHKLCYNT
jgi:hypothetical protein